MSENASSEGASLEADKPVQATDDDGFPPLPEPTDSDFEEEVGEEEKAHYKSLFPDLKQVVSLKLHCTACDRHLGCSARNDTRMRAHPMLKTLICHACHSFYNSGEFDKGEDGSELYCRWCGQGGQVYCCSDCIHVFCAKCIKRNFGIAKIKEIENTDDWKCFKCNPRCLWDMRALCWALMRFCDYRNRIVAKTDNPELKEKYQKMISVDLSECCRNRGRKKEKVEVKKKEKETIAVVDVAKKIISKIPPTIQVKKFASINMEDTPKTEKKTQKRPASPKIKIQNTGYITKPVTIAPCNMMTTPILKKMRMPTAPILTPVRFSNEKKILNTYTRFTASRPRQPFPIPIVNSPFNGLNSTPDFNNVHTMPSTIAGDNINLSLETLTQGLDLAAFNNSNSTENSVVCTPDLLEPLCEVYEDNDDDVECITPGPVVPPKTSNPPLRTLPDLSSDNIVQMTENDVTVNSVTGGLKFRVDPQTLSSKKMYRLPDGRIFAINPNPSMPGGYSATIVSVSDSTGKIASKSGETFSAKLSTVIPSSTSSQNNSNSKTSRNTSTSRKNKNKSTVRTKSSTPTKKKDVTRSRRESDFKVPVEWYRYNLIDAVDALDYSLSRLNKLKREVTTAHLRSRTVDEMKYLHRTLEQLLSTSSKRFLEIRENLNKELKQYISQKMNGQKGEVSEDDEDDDVEILPDAGNDDPIFIDENSIDSIDDTQEVDLTGAPSSEHNDSSENKNETDPLLCQEQLTEKSDDSDKTNENSNHSEAENPNLSSIPCNSEKVSSESKTLGDEQESLSHKKDNDVTKITTADNIDGNEKNKQEDTDKECATEEHSDKEKNSDSLKDNKEKQSEISEASTGEQKSSETNGETEKAVDNDDEAMEVDSHQQSESKDKADQSDDKPLSSDMSEEIINTLLEDDTMESVIDNVVNANSLDISLDDKE